MAAPVAARPAGGAPVTAWLARQPAGRLAGLGTLASLATCYAKLGTAALISAGVLGGEIINPHVQAAVMSVSALVAVLGLYLDRRTHGSGLPLLFGTAGAATVIGTLYIRYSEAVEFTGYFLLVVAVLINQNRRLEALNRQVADMNEALEARAREAERATRAKSRFLSSMSHELRTPLNAIIGISEMLHEDAVAGGDPDTADAQGRVVRASRHLQSLVDDILDLSRIEAGRVDLQPERIDVRGFLSDVEMTTRELASANGNTLTVSCADDVGTVHTDPVRLRQIVLNLVGNACKFTRDGAIGIEAHADTAGGGAQLVLRVTDTGVGMSEEELAVVFEEFAQAGDRSQRSQGTGLGLAISQRLCRLMGGEITADSRPGEGSTFTVRLPA